MDAGLLLTLCRDREANSGALLSLDSSKQHGVCCLKEPAPGVQVELWREITLGGDVVRKGL
jgi:hypothetical protein